MLRLVLQVDSIGKSLLGEPSAMVLLDVPTSSPDQIIHVGSSPMPHSRSRSTGTASALAWEEQSVSAEQPELLHLQPVVFSTRRTAIAHHRILRHRHPRVRRRLHPQQVCP